MKRYTSLLLSRLSVLKRDRRGDMYVELLVSLLVILSLIWGFVKFMPLYPIKQNVDYMANQLVRTIELTGEVGAEYYAELSRLKAATRLEPSISISTTYIADTKIQLRERLSVTVSVVEKIEIFSPAFTDPVTIDVPVSKTVTGMSEVYWKTT